jgi:hypothetical protein
MSHDLAMVKFLSGSITMLESQSKEAKAKLLVFVISDGRFNKDNLRTLTLEAKEKGFLYVFIILDKYEMDNNNS